MTRPAAACAALVTLAVLVALTLRVETDARAVFGDASTVGAALDSPEGRRLSIAVISADVAARTDAARALAETLAANPLVEDVVLGPPPPDPALVAWLWTHRFRLSPPRPADLSAKAMTARLEAARAQLFTPEGRVLGDFFLRDPTGSFARVISSLRAARPAIPHSDGVWQAQDDSAALLFVTLAAGDYRAERVLALAETLRAATDLELMLIGPRLVAAETEARISRAAQVASALASVLILGWLSWALGSARAVGLALLPLGIGLASGVLAVQIFFGSVHVLALGFGGALCGLALDYPLHLLGHGASHRPRARRLVLIGAATTALAFLAVIGAGLPAFAEMGVLVASGLLTAALVGRWLLLGQEAPVRALPLWRLAMPIPSHGLICLLLAGVGAITVALTPGESRLTAPPPGLEADLARLSQMVPLPSGRVQLIVTGATPQEVRRRAEALKEVLDGAVDAGELRGYRLLSPILPGGPADLPPEPVLRTRAEAALSAAGMNLAFAEAIEEAYASARTAPAITYQDFAARTGLSPLIEGPEGWSETVSLFGVDDPEALRTRLGDLPGVTFAEPAADLAAQVTSLQSRVLLWLSLGAAAAGVLLAAAVGLRRARSVALSVAGALGLAATLLTLSLGPLGVFQIMALTLVTGIGVDYGLFLGTAQTEEEFREATRSVGLSAVSTLAAFGVMALAPAAILSEIGVTVSLGVLAVLGLSLSQPRQGLSMGEAR